MLCSYVDILKMTLQRKLSTKCEPSVVNIEIVLWISNINTSKN